MYKKYIMSFSLIDKWTILATSPPQQRAYGYNIFELIEWKDVEKSIFTVI